jgi:hypothetical protein
MRNKYSLARILPLAGTFVLFCTGALGTDQSGADRLSAVNCGSLSLLVMLRLEGRSVEPTIALSSLPTAQPEGFSLLELQDASRALGLELAAVQLPKDTCIDRPILMFLSRENHGHYVVVRPVGHTGTLVQVIDPITQSTVIDVKSLFASSQWTGIGLAPYRASWTRRFAIGFVLIGMPTAVWVFYWKKGSLGLTGHASRADRTG